MNRIVLMGLLMLLTVSSVKAQIGYQVGFIQPLGLYGAEVKAGAGLELLYRDDPFDDPRWIVGAGIGLYFHRTRQDTFYTLHEGSGGGTNVPDYEGGYRTYLGNVYLFVPVSGTVDYRLGFGDFSPFVGVDANLHVSLYQMDYQNATFSSNESGSANLSIGPRVGVYYILNDDWVICTGLTRPFTLVVEEGNEGHYKAFFSLLKQF